MHMPHAWATAAHTTVLDDPLQFVVLLLTTTARICWFMPDHQRMKLLLVMNWAVRKSPFWAQTGCSAKNIRRRGNYGRSYLLCSWKGTYELLVLPPVAHDGPASASKPLLAEHTELKDDGNRITHSWASWVLYTNAPTPISTFLHAIVDVKTPISTATCILEITIPS